MLPHQLAPLLAMAFPAALREEAAAPCREVFSVYRPIYDHAPRGARVLVAGEPLRIPTRLHISGQLRVERFSEMQNHMLACLSTRASDGYVRQAALRELMPSLRPWSAPFVAALIGEYVVEILDDIRDAMPQIGPGLAVFFKENRDYLELTRARVTSYWDCYYRYGVWARADYPGFGVIAEIERLIE